jgi:O-antigen/teichoic acid export membrane protein
MTNKILSYKDNQDFLKYFKNTSWLFGEKVLRIVVGIFVGVWIARYLGPERFGLFSYAQSFAGLFVVIANLGLDGIIVRELVKNESRIDEIIGTAFWLKLIGAIAVLCILVISIQFTSDDRYTNILIFIIASAAIFQSFNVIDFYFQSKVLSRYVVFANVISLLISSLVKIVLIILEAPVVAFAWAVLFDSLVLATGLIYFYFRKSSHYKQFKEKHHLKLNAKYLTFKRKAAISLLKDSWPLIIAAMAVVIYKKIDQVMLKNILNNSIEVGYYAAAVQVTKGFSFIPSVVAQSIFPKLISNYQTNIDYKRIFLIINSSLIYFALFLYLFVLQFSDSIISFLYGNEYEKSSTILILHFAVNIFIFAGVMIDKLIILENRQASITLRVLIGVVINIVLNYLLIPQYGAIGAAYATIVSQFFTSVMLLLLFKSSRKYFFWQIQSFFYPLSKALFFLKRIRI